MTSSVEMVRQCLDRIAEIDPAVQAWTHLDPDYALEQAAARDAERATGAPLGPLHGVPVGVKDIFDTADMPTEYGTAIHAGHQPSRDSAAVACLRAAGAVIMGKTVTTEFALFTPGKTTNPHDPTRTPGGSSSGSAAAVAAAMIPLAVGSQTKGSVVRPASFCGVIGYKPTHGLISRAGVLALSRTLDHVGVFARTLGEAALAAEALVGFDDNDPDTRPRAPLRLAEAAAEGLDRPPRLAFVRQPAWETASEDVHAAFAKLTETLGAHVVSEVELPPAFAEFDALHDAIMGPEAAHNLGGDYARAGDAMSAKLRDIIERGQAVPAIDYLGALERTRRLNDLFDEMLAGYDAAITPATTGEAPASLETTGDPVFCTIWSLLGTPALNLPLAEGANGLPIGVQMVAGRNADRRLLRTAQWLLTRLGK